MCGDASAALADVFWIAHQLGVMSRIAFVQSLSVQAAQMIIVVRTGAFFHRVPLFCLSLLWIQGVIGGIPCFIDSNFFNLKAAQRVDQAEKVNRIAVAVCQR